MNAPLLQSEAAQRAARPIEPTRGASRRRKSAESAASSTAWTPARVELLKSLIAAGYSCRQIADEIGVTRNAVIGKVNRLGLSRPRGTPAASRETREPKRAPWRPKIVGQQALLLRLPPEPVPRLEDISIFAGRGCSLLELSAGKCRWPINEPGAENFCFCGNTPLDGFPYCVGHVRIAYKSAARRRAFRVSPAGTPAPGA